VPFENGPMESKSVDTWRGFTSPLAGSLGSAVSFSAGSRTEVRPPPNWNKPRFVRSRRGSTLLRTTLASTPHSVEHKTCGEGKGGDGNALEWDLPLMTMIDDNGDVLQWQLI